MQVYIIDDDEAVGRTIARFANRAGWDTDCFDSADGFLARIDELPFGCIVSDINMPGMNGIELIEALHARCPEWPVIMMTAFGEVTAAIRSFRHGAVHFLQKPFKRADFLSALGEAVDVGTRRQQESHRRQQSKALEKLTKRETEVLGALADGLQSKTIAWQLGISTRTVEMHRSNILNKLGARNTSQAVGLLQMGNSR
ncbi:MAG: response regulator transcription factor [Sphingosinicella sp.]|uniref:response regulator transcription factor n=1 Tax=Sphingosinicella sp. TaxID=1917971 RepID=UPI0040379426